jgi:HEAT repeat protein
MDKRKEVFIGALRDSDPQVRNIAAAALEKFEIRARLDFLSRKLDSGDTLERIRVVYALASLKGQGIMELLLKASRDASEDVRAASVRVLGSTGEQAAQARIVEALNDRSAVVARVAVESLGYFRDPKLLAPLMQMLKSQDEGVVERAIELIGKIGDRRAEEAMLYFAVKGNPKMRGLALKALGEMDG